MNDIMTLQFYIIYTHIHYKHKLLNPNNVQDALMVNCRTKLHKLLTFCVGYVTRLHINPTEAIATVAMT